VTRLHCVRQRDETDCGAACLATVCRQYGVEQPLGRVRAIAGTDRLGTSAYGLVRAAEQLGFSARGVKGDLAALLETDDLRLPVIAHIITEDGILHYVVVHRIENGIVTVADPARGIVKQSAEEFAKLWSGVLIILTPASDGLVQGPGEDPTLRRFLGLLRGQGRFITLLTLSSALITLIGIVSAFYFKVIIDDIVPGALWRTLTTVSLAIIGLYLVSALLNAARYQLVLHLRQRINIPLILGYYNHVTGLPMSFFGTRKVGEIITRFSDAGRIQQALTGATVTVLVDVVMSVAGCVILARQDRLLFWIVVAVAIGHVILGLVVLRPVRQLNEQLMEGNAQVTSHFVESIKGTETVKAYNAQPLVKGKADTLYMSLLKTVLRFGRWENAQSVVSNILRDLGNVLVLWIGAVRILNGDMTIGGLVVFTTLMNYFLNPVERLMGLQPELQSAAVAARRLTDVLVLEAERLDGDGQVRLERIDAPIVLKDVDFRYGTRAKVLRQVSLTIPSGAAVGLVGESGSGKTTIAKLLMKFYAAESGTVRFGNLAVEDITAESLRDRIAYVAQDTTFFSGTIEENLRLAAPQATREDMIAACQVAQAHDFIAEMPAGYSSRLEEDATNLSGGQRQRLAIARALLRGADMLIMDEATSNMDSLSEKAVSDTIQNLGAGITRLVIAHRLSTVAACDLIYVMKAGRVVESGTHAQLLAAGGEYWALWSAQAGGQTVPARQGIPSVPARPVSPTTSPAGAVPLWPGDTPVRAYPVPASSPPSASSVGLRPSAAEVPSRPPVPPAAGPFGPRPSMQELLNRPSVRPAAPPLTPAPVVPTQTSHSGLAGAGAMRPSPELAKRLARLGVE